MDFKRSRPEQVRLEVLTQCYGYRPGSRDAEHMASLARRDGEIADAVPAEFETEAAYLAGKGLVEILQEELAKGHKRYKITSAGIDYLEANGLV
jgi:hypothetical protein